MHRGHVGRLERVGQDLDLDASSGHRGELGGPLLAGDEIGRQEPERHRRRRRCLLEASPAAADRSSRSPNPLAGSSLTMRTVDQSKAGGSRAGRGPGESRRARLDTRRLRRSWATFAAAAVRVVLAAASIGATMRCAGYAESLAQYWSKLRDTSPTTGPIARASRSTNSTSLAGVEVLVADIAPADHAGQVVDGERLVVHATVQSLEVEQIAERTRAASRERVEQSHLDIRLRGERGERLVEPRRVGVVEQQAHAHAAGRGAPQCLDEQRP